MPLSKKKVTQEDWGEETMPPPDEKETQEEEDTVASTKHRGIPETMMPPMFQTFTKTFQDLGG